MGLAFSLIWPSGQFSLVVAMSMCLFVPLQLIVDYAKTVRDSVFIDKIDCIYIFLETLILKRHYNCIIGLKVTA